MARRGMSPLWRNEYRLLWRAGDSVTEDWICLDCKRKDPIGVVFSVIRENGIESVQWGGEDGCENEVYDRGYLARAAAQDMLAALFARGPHGPRRPDPGGVHNAGITKDIEALRAICLVFCRVWNDEIVPVLQKATGMENPVGKVALSQLPPDMALADVSSFVREYQHLAGLDGDAAIIEAMQRDHEWTTKGSTVLLKAGQTVRIVRAASTAGPGYCPVHRGWQQGPVKGEFL